MWKLIVQLLDMIFELVFRCIIKSTYYTKYNIFWICGTKEEAQKCCLLKKRLLKKKLILSLHDRCAPFLSLYFSAYVKFSRNLIYFKCVKNDFAFIFLWPLHFSKKDGLISRQVSSFQQKRKMFQAGLRVGKLTVFIFLNKYS